MLATVGSYDVEGIEGAKGFRDSALDNVHDWRKVVLKWDIEMGEEGAWGGHFLYFFYRLR